MVSGNPLVKLFAIICTALICTTVGRLTFFQVARAQTASALPAVEPTLESAPPLVRSAKTRNADAGEAATEHAANTSVTTYLTSPSELLQSNGLRTGVNEAGGAQPKSAYGKQLLPLVGRVVDAQGVAVASAKVVVQGAWIPSIASNVVPDLAISATDESGNFKATTIPERPAEGTEVVAIWVYKAGYSLRCVQTVKRDFYEIQLPAEERFSVRVADPSGRPMERINVAPFFFAAEQYASHSKSNCRFIPAELQSLFQSQTDTNGEATFVGLRKQQVDRVAVEHKLFGKQIFPPATSIELRPASPLTGQVICFNEPLPQPLQITLRTEQLLSDTGVPSYGYATVDVDQSGNFALPAMAVGSLMATMDWPSNSSLRPVYDRMEVRAGEPCHLTIHAKQTLELRGSVVDSRTGRPIPKVSVQIQSTQKPFQAASSEHAITDNMGSFSARVFPGRARMNVFQFNVGQYSYPGTSEIEIPSNAKVFHMLPIHANPRL